MKPHFILITLALSLWIGNAAALDLGDRLELFTDDALIAERQGLRQEAVLPQPKEVVIETNEAWEGNTCAYFAIFQDGDRYKMYYRGSAADPETKKSLHREVTCLAESTDGITWTKPKLGLFEYEGSKDNNIVWFDWGTHNFTPFLDSNPAATPDARYKALAGGTKAQGGGLVPLQSADGIHWKPMAEKAVITAGAFDSQNLAFWDASRGEYRAYWRIFTNKIRAIRTATSKDFLTWEDQADLTYNEGTPDEHLYTNAILPYFRAPHLFLGFPTRFLPKEGQRVEPVFMSSRDAVKFHRYPNAIVPEDAPEDRRGNRSNYMTWGLLSLPGKPDELSVYATESYYGPKPCRVRRFVYRTDGFVKLTPEAGAGHVVTKPLTFTGKQLQVNYVAREGGSVKVELQDESGKALGESEPLTKDEIAGAVTWKNGVDLAAHAGKPVKLKISLDKADLYSLRFANP